MESHHVLFRTIVVEVSCQGGLRPLSALPVLLVPVSSTLASRGLSFSFFSFFSLVSSPLLLSLPRKQIYTTIRHDAEFEARPRSVLRNSSRNCSTASFRV